ncbi:ABC transporter ATP-binding protein [Devosia riboflavina]|uniref:ABC transporter ATP-binding protein n=1 Tax=Devosia riboflavina TaxID=46914 RepID=A0A087LZF4_9HYPH|nr:sn-glycerol-3-phosphate ABC transporter ATP-binding protein UgpC [Devosia riboflavina]KFL30007.1 ABC transporter ATP-binding protein [Devosia riboflavina]
MSDLRISGLKKSYGSVSVLKGIDLTIEAGEFVVFVGPSGCGKSTLLRMIAGLEDITDGSIAIGGRVVNDLPPADRAIAMVFQSYALYPHMTVRDNMSFGMRMAKEPKAEIEQRVNRAAEMLQLTPLLDRLPKQLSGGQRQRVAIGRAITRDPKVFLFDEPLSNLDAALRVATRIEIARLKQSMPDTTMIYVTHDQVEAMTLADRIVVMRAGSVEQVGTPLELYHTPANRFVAGFIGSPAMNFLPVTRVDDGRIKAVEGDAIDLPFSAPVEAGTVLGVRPEDLTLASGSALIRGRASVIENLGELAIVYVDAGTPEPVIVKLPGNSSLRPGDAVALTAPADRLHLFAADGLALRPR